jgi:hypothetical protein
MKMNIGIFPTRLNFDQRMRLRGRQLADDFCWQEAEVACREGSSVFRMVQSLL